jgi:hypothetical protein
MTDDTVINAEDPLQSDAVAKEAGLMVGEGEAVECLTNAFERYIQNYQDSWQKDWQDGIQAFAQEVENWQNSIAAVQTKTPTCPASGPASSAAEPARKPAASPASKKNTPPSGT